MTHRERAITFITTLPAFPKVPPKELEKWLRKHEAKQWRHLIEKLEYQFAEVADIEHKRQESLQKLMSKPITDRLTPQKDRISFTHTGVKHNLTTNEWTPPPKEKPKS